MTAVAAIAEARRAVERAARRAPRPSRDRATVALRREQVSALADGTLTAVEIAKRLRHDVRIIRLDLRWLEARSRPCAVVKSERGPGKARWNMLPPLVPGLSRARHTLSPLCLCFLRAVAERAGEDGWAHVPLSGFAPAIGQHRRTIQRQLVKLADSGMLERRDPLSDCWRLTERGRAVQAWNRALLFGGAP